MESPPPLNEWLKTETARLRKLRGEPFLAALWDGAQHLACEGHVDVQIRWLNNIMKGASRESRIDYTLQAFSELRRIYAADARFADLRGKILWYFKWLLEKLPDYADVPLATIEAIFGEMESFYATHRESPRPIYGLRLHTAIQTGHKDDATAWHAKWQAAPKGGSDDCEACEIDQQVVYFLNREESAEALAAAEPILRGETACDETPRTLTRLVAPALKAGRVQLALAMLRASRRDVRRLPTLLSPMSAHVVLHVMIGDFCTSRRLALLALRRALDATNDANRCHAYRNCGLWAALMILAGKHDATLPRRLMPGGGAAGDVGLAEAAALCLAEANAIAARLDARNGTTRFADQLLELEKTIARAVEQGTPKPR